MKKSLYLTCIVLALTGCFDSSKDKKLIDEISSQFLDMTSMAYSTSSSLIALSATQSPAKYKYSIQELESIKSALTSFVSKTSEQLSSLSQDAQLASKSAPLFLKQNPLQGNPRKVILALPLAKMEEQRKSLQQLTVCYSCKQLKKDILTYMDTIISSFKLFFTDANDDLSLISKANEVVLPLSNTRLPTNCVEYNKMVKTQNKN